MFNSLEQSVMELKFRRYTDRYVLIGILKIAAKAQSRKYIHLSVRWIAEQAGIADKTASKSLRRLENAGYIKCTYKSNTPDCSTYELLWGGETGCRCSKIGNLLKDRPNIASGSSPKVDEEGVEIHDSLGLGRIPAFNSDLFMAYGLGKNAYLVLTALSLHPEGLTVKELCLLVPVIPSSAYYTLRKLEYWGAVTKSQKIYTLDPEFDFEALAQKLASHGLSQHRKEVHIQQRNAYCRYFDAQEGDDGIDMDEEPSTITYIAGKPITRNSLIPGKPILYVRFYYRAAIRQMILHEPLQSCQCLTCPSFLDRIHRGPPINDWVVCN